ncbi:unnamed protein product [Durusdinium trenchii]|uniref:EF-hand domain-containing protein n=1 Tax=Durusdinium trenchii TaxID=1381693 RepID=A0ABP0JVY1_9DINO
MFVTSTPLSSRSKGAESPKRERLKVPGSPQARHSTPPTPSAERILRTTPAMSPKGEASNFDVQTVKDIVQEQLAIASVDVLVGNKVGGSWAEQGRACGQATHDPGDREKRHVGTVEPVLLEEPAGADEVKEARVAEEFEKLRQRNYKAISRCACHFNLLTALGLVHEAIQKPGCDTITWAFFCIMSYLQFLLIASERVGLTPQRLKCLSFCMHLMKILLIISSAHSETTFRFAVLQSIAAAMRFCPVIVFLDPWMSIPFQVLYTAMEMSAHLLVFDQSSLELGPLCVSQFFTLTATISSSVFIHLVLRGRFEALLDTADAESLVSSFQRVLRGACDGEVLLDSQMNIAQESQCLKHLILTNVSLKGRSFQQLLVDEEQHRFLEFIHTSTQTLGTPESKDFLPLCLRVSFRGSAGIRVAADIYHVPVPGLFGSSDPYHLIAFKEDSEPRPLPEAEEDTVPSILLNKWGTGESRAKGRTCRPDGRASTISGSTGRSSCLQNICPELQEITMLVDVTTELQDVQQVHLNFERIFRAEEEEGELRDDLVEGMQCGMPSLRKLVKPTEWEKIRSSVVRFAEKAALDPYLQPKVLKRMTVHLPGQSGWLIAEEVNEESAVGDELKASDETTVWLPLHLAFTRSDFAELKQFSTFFLFPQAQDELKEARVDEEMIKLRQRNYKFVSRCVCHINLFTCLGLIHEAVRAPGLDTMTSLGLCTVCYVQYLIVGSGWVELTPLIMEVLSFVTHLLLIPVILSTCASASIFKFAVMQGLQVAMRFCPVVLFLDPWISIPFQVLYTATETSMYFFVFDRNTLELGPLCERAAGGTMAVRFPFARSAAGSLKAVSQFFILVSTVASSIFIDLLLRGRLYALFETADAESLVSSFRRVLRGACDGEVLLDGQMNVAQESECLKHLILTNVSLKGRSFQHLLVDEEQQRFHEFINTSTQAFGTPESKGSALPLCLRVSFRGSAGIQVGADIYHVPVPGLFGSSTPYHLIAFKEDSEPRPLPEAEEDAVPSELVNAWADGTRPDKRGALGASNSSVSGSTGKSSGIAIEEYCPELQEITMLVDVTTELQDVQQAHLNFERCADTGDLRLALQSSMPSLRKLVKPTDWEKIRSSVARFAEKALRDPDLQPKALRHMTVQLPGQSGWQIAEVATLHRIQGAQKVWLYLKGLRPEKARRVPKLDGIQERGVRERRRALQRLSPKAVTSRAASPDAEAEKRQKSTSYRPKAEQSIQEIIREQVLLQEQLRPLAEGGEFEWRNHAPKSCPKDPYYQEDPVSGMDAVASAGIAGGVAGEALSFPLDEQITSLTTPIGTTRISTELPGFTHGAAEQSGAGAQKEPRKVRRSRRPSSSSSGSNLISTRKRIDVAVKLPDGRTAWQRIHPEATTYQLKQCLDHEWQFREPLSLSFLGLRLKDHWRLVDCGVRGHDKLQASVASARSARSASARAGAGAQVQGFDGQRPSFHGAGPLPSLEEAEKAEKVEETEESRWFLAVESMERGMESFQESMTKSQEQQQEKLSECYQTLSLLQHQQQQQLQQLCSIQEQQRSTASETFRAMQLEQQEMKSRLSDMHRELLQVPLRSPPRSPQRSPPQRSPQQRSPQQRPPAPNPRTPSPQRVATAESKHRRWLILQVFRMLDNDRDGKLQQQELIGLARLMGFNFGEDDWAMEYQDLCRDMDVSPQSGFDLRNFTRLLDSEDGCPASDENLFEALIHHYGDQERARETALLFEKLDVDQDGFLSAPELRSFGLEQMCLEGHDHYGRYDLQTFYLLAKTLSLEQLRGEAPIVPSPIQSVIPAVSDSARARSAVVLVSEAELIEEAAPSTPSSGTDRRTPRAEPSRRAELVQRLFGLLDGDKDGRCGAKDLTVFASRQSEVWTLHFRKLCKHWKVDPRQGMDVATFTQILEDQTGPFGLYCSDQEIEDLIAQSRSERRPSTQDRSRLVEALFYYLDSDKDGLLQLSDVQRLAEDLPNVDPEEVTRWSSDVVPLDLEAFRTRVNRREECIYCDDAALQRGLARTPPSRKLLLYVKSWIFRNNATKDLWPVGELCCKAMRAFIPLGDWLHAQSGESLCIFEFDDEWNAMWKECKVQAAWHECQEAHAGQTLLPNFTGHGMRARSRVGRRELLEDELEEKRPPSGPRFTSKPRDFVFLSTSADVRVVAQAGQVEFLCDSSLLFRASPFFVAALREDCWLEGHTRILHFPEDEEIWSGGQASRSGHDFESGASLLTVTTT